MTNNKQITMTKNQTSKPAYDLEERTYQFAKAVRFFVKTLPKTIANIEDGKQLIKASGSVGANYIEANESLGFAACKLEFSKFGYLILEFGIYL